MPLTRVARMGCIALALVCTLSASGAAQRDEEGVAKGLFQAGKAAYDAGRYEEALSFFEQAYEHSGRPRMLYNIAQAADRARRDERAIEAFRGFLALLPDDPLRPEVEKRVAALEQALAERAAQASQVAAAISPAAVTDPAPASETPAVQRSLATPAAARNEDSGGLLSKWWVWATAAVIVGAGVTAAVLVLDGKESVTNAPIAGEVGGVVQTLGRF
jgi:tetratricopeptide (TPR) repeat protein